MSYKIFDITGIFLNASELIIDQMLMIFTGLVQILNNLGFAAELVQGKYEESEDTCLLIFVIGLTLQI
jgi:hypothetical protein